MKTWKVLEWKDKPPVTGSVELRCDCGHEADVPIGDPGCLIIARIGMGLVLDPPGHIPPPNFMPNGIKCRKCGRVYREE